MSKESSINEYISKAKKIINDDEKLKKLIEDVLKKLKEISSDKKTSAKLNDSLRLFIRIINAYTSKEYTYVPWKTICLIVAGLIYFIYVNRHIYNESISVLFLKIKKTNL